MNKSSIKLIGVFTVIIAVIYACAINPVTGKKQISFMSEAREIAMGKESDPAIVAQFGLYENEEIQQFIESRGQEMAAISHRSGLDYEFKVLDSPVVNAFAVPGGYVYFTRGILAHFNNEAQFAGVLGHEIGHVTARHSAQQYTKQMLTQVAFMGGMIASEKFRSMAGEAMQGMELLFMKFSRSDESESDYLGVQYSCEVGYDAHHMADFFNTLSRLSTNDDGERIPEFMSTHPDPGRRYQEVNRMTDAWQAENGNNNTKVNRDSYLEMIDGLVYGEDPRQGYVENNIFYQPELKFEYPIPKDWEYVNSPIQVQMAPKNGEAMMILTLSSEKTLSAATQGLTEQYGLTIDRQQEMTVHGLPAYGLVATLPQEDQSGEAADLKVQAVLIEYNELIYVFLGLTTPDKFSKYEPHFDNTMLNFRELTDQNKMTVYPEVLKITPVNQTTTVEQFLINNNVPKSRHNELSILNGKELSEIVNSGDKLKLIVKSNLVNN